MEKAGSSNITFGDTAMAVLGPLEDTNYQKDLDHRTFMTLKRTPPPV